MAKGLTPIIGLAVVVALALAAVFGAMSLTNPAFAAVGAPADAELAERTFSPETVRVPQVTSRGGDKSVTLVFSDLTVTDIKETGVDQRWLSMAQNGRYVGRRVMRVIPLPAPEGVGRLLARAMKV